MNSEAWFFLALLFVGGLVWVALIEPNWFFLRSKTVRIKKLLPRPLTILHLSDLHFTRRRFLLERFFDRLARLDVDFVFVTGDLIDGPGGIRPCVENLRKLKPRRGIYAVLGNHDYWVYPPFERVFQKLIGRRIGRNRPETERLKGALREAGIRLLENENVQVELTPDQDAILIGIDDPVTNRADYEKAFQGIQDGTLQMALVHSPMSFPSLAQREIDMAFAGHTHGGQIRLPAIGPLPLVYFLEPIIDSTDAHGFSGLVSRGLASQPLAHYRLFCRPEAVLVRIEGLARLGKHLEFTRLLEWIHHGAG